ncbi:hypothetical protein R3P38DRAFT_2749785, partial [Favolaschia claudopus]
MTTSRQLVVQQCIEDYEKWCKRVSEDYDKNFKFPKQHYLIHALDDVRLKGVLRNGTTRTGEGIHQEVKQHYGQTNKRNTEAQQISIRDEDQEVVARTRLLIDDFFRRASQTAELSDASSDTDATNQEADNQWIFGSPLQYSDSRSYEDFHGGNNPIYRALDPRLREFLHSQFPDEYLTYEDTI